MSNVVPATAACPRCNGTGFYSYDENHIKPCEVCCRHDRGWFPLTEAHGRPGMHACGAGCGAILEQLGRDA